MKPICKELYTEEQHSRQSHDKETLADDCNTLSFMQNTEYHAVAMANLMEEAISKSKSSASPKTHPNSINCTAKNLRL
jgi:hypothetical protein